MTTVGLSANSTTSLNTAIAQANADPGNNYIITIANGFTLNADITAINRPVGSSLTIVSGSGGPFTINGNNQFSGFFDYSGGLTLQNLTIADTTAQGQAGANGYNAGDGGGGGGLGAGGGLFVGASGSATLSGVYFTGDRAIGGNVGHVGGFPNNRTSQSGSYEPRSGVGGGGGGAGFGPGAVAAANGASSHGGTGGSSGLGGVGSGGSGGGSSGTYPGADRSASGGQSVIGTFGGGGGGGGEGYFLHIANEPQRPYAAGQGGAGGFGGGGGGGGLGNTNGAGGAGGFGGGGGTGGGYYGGYILSAGGEYAVGYGARGTDGFGARDGGGLGAGGAIFVESGGLVSFTGGGISLGGVIGGTGAGGSGSALGSGIFIQGNNTVTFTTISGQALTISDEIDDQTGSAGEVENPLAGAGAIAIGGAGTLVLANSNNDYTGGTTLNGGILSISADGDIGSAGTLALNNGTQLDLTASFSLTRHSVSLTGTVAFDVASGDTATIATGISNGSSAGVLDKTDSGTLALTATNSYSGGTTIGGGTLELGAAGAAGSGAITFSGATDGILKIDNSALTAGAGGSKTIANTIDGFVPGQTIQLASVTLDSSYTATLQAGNVLKVAGDGTTYLFDLNTAQNYSGDQFVVNDVAGGGTDINAIVPGQGITLTAADETELNTDIQQIDSGPPSQAYQINITGDFSLTSQMDAFNLPAGASVVIVGGGHTIDGGVMTLVNSVETDVPTYRGFFVYSGNVTLQDLTLKDMLAQGGAGGGGGGGGAGLGGGLFIGSTGNVTLDNVTFQGDVARGGYGSTRKNTSGVPYYRGTFNGGGGGGLGGNASGSTGGDTGLSYVPNNGGTPYGNAGGFGGGGAGAAGTTISAGNAFTTGGGKGGFGGGGGGPGSYRYGGAGGFGGGGGGSIAGDSNLHGAGGKGGFGGGNGKSYGFSQSARFYAATGGGGLGAGGAIFVQSGGSLTFAGGSVYGGKVYAGLGYKSNPGSALGSGIFLYGNEVLTLSPPSGTQTISNDIADSTGYLGAGSLKITGPGTVVLGGNNTFSGGTKLTGGALSISSDANLGSGGTLAMSAGTTLDLTLLAGGGQTNDFTLAHTISVTGDPLFDVASGVICTDTALIQNGTSAGTVEKSGPGTLVLDFTNTYSGGTTIDAGTLELAASGAAGSGAIAFAANADATLQIDNAALASGGTGILTFTGNPIGGFTLGDIIDLRGATFSAGAAAPTLGAGNLLSFTENGTTYKIQLKSTDSFSGYSFTLASDGSGGTDLQTVLLGIGGTGNTAQFYQGQASPTTVDAGITITAAAHIASATVTVSSGFLSGDTLSFNNGTNTETFGDGAIVNASQTGDALTLTTTTGNATASDYQTALQSVVYSFTGDPTNAGADTVRTVTWSATDVNTNTSSAATTLDVFAQPIVSTGTFTAPTVTQTSGAVTADPSLNVTDYNGATLAGATVAITAGFQTGDTLNDRGVSNGGLVSGTASIHATYNSVTETLTLSGTDTVADYIAALREVQFNVANGNSGTRTLTWIVNDQAGGHANDSVSVTTSATAAFGPSVALATTAAYTQAGGTVTLSPSVTLGDTESSTLAGATVEITGGTFAGDGDVLSASTFGTSISASYNAASETLTLSGSDTLADYQGVLESVTFDDDGSDNPTNYGADPKRTVTWLVNDGSLNSTPVTTTVSITAVNQPPTVNSVAPGAQFTQGGSAVTLSGAASVSDPDNHDLSSATVEITGGTFAGDGDVLNATTSGTGISASYDTATETLTLSGTDTLQNYQTVLDSVTFNSTSLNPTDYGADPTRTVTWVLNDGAGSNNLSAAATTTVSITAVNQAPTFGNLASVAQFTEGGSAVVLSNAASVSDPDNQDLSSATVEITGGTFAGDGDVLNATTSGTGISASYDTATETLTLSGTDTLQNYQTVLDSVTFNSTSLNPDDYGADPTRIVTWVLNDGSGSNNLSTAQTTTIDVTAVNNPPTLTGVATSVSFASGQGAVTLSGAASVSDVDSQDLSSATVQITGGTFAGDGDVLSASTSGTAISASYDTASETLTLSGSDTLANYQSALDSITFDSTASDPTDAGADLTRTVTWVLNDGSGSNNLSAAQTETVNVHARPTVDATGSAAYVQSNGQSNGAVTLDANVSVGDPSSATLVSATVSIAGGTFAGDGDVLAATTTGTSISASYDTAGETLTLTGTDTLANYQSVLDSITFNSTSLNPTDYGADPNRTVTWLVNDGTLDSTPATTTVSITAVNQPPTFGNWPTGAQFTENGAAVTLSTGATVSDPDNLDLSSATVSITTGTFTGDGDLLSADTAGTSINASYDTATETLTLSGTDTLQNYQTVLDSVAFSDSSHNPTDYGADPTRTVTWVLNDGSASNNLSTAATITVTIAPVNNPPTLGNVATGAQFTQDGSAVTLSSAASVSDPDNQDLSSATVQMTGGTFAGDGDVLSASTTGTSISASYDAASETLMLSGSDTLTDYETVLDSVTFDSTSLNPTDYGADPTRTVTWMLNDGSASNNLSTAVTTTVSITAVNQSPTLDNVATGAQFTEGNATVALSNAVSVIDPDNQDLSSATVQITGGTFAGDGDLLSADTDGTGINASYDAATETLTLSGADTLQDYQTVLDTAAFSDSSDNPTDYGADPTRIVTWVLNDGSGSNNLSVAHTTTVTITAVNDPPTLGNVATGAQFTEGGSAVTLSNAVSVSDPDNQDLSSATVTVAGGTFAGDGDVLAASAGGTSINASYDAATETLTLTGTDTLADYQSVLDSVTFNSTSLNPTDYGADPTRTVTWVLDDGSASSNLSTAVTTTVSITAVNQAPTLGNVATGAQFTEGNSTVALSNAVSVTDPDNQDLSSATVKIGGGTFTGDGDVLSFDAAGTSINASYDVATETLTLSGADTLQNYQTVLDSVAFSDSSSNPTDYGADPNRIITWQLNDGSASNNLSATATTTVTITAVNNPPTLGNVASDAQFTESGMATTLSNAASVSDPDNQDLSSATVKIIGGTFAGDGDVLAASTTGTSINASYTAATETLTLSGTDTLAHYQSVLDRLTFDTTSINPTDYGADPTRTVTWVLNDGSASNDLSTVATTTVSITAINQAPTLGSVATGAHFTEGGSAVVLSNAASVSDSDNQDLSSATVRVSGGTFAGDGDVLAFNTGGTSINANYNAATETLTLSGTDTLAHYQSVLDSITFNSTSPNPTDYGADPTRTVTWVLNDGSASNNLSTAATTTVSITAVNQPPTLGNAASAAQFTQGGSAVTLSSAASVSDPDNQDLSSATVKITGGTFAGDGDVLSAATAGTSISASYDNATETLTLSGSDTLAHYQSVLDHVTFNSTSLNPTDYGADPTRTVTWVLNDGSASSNLSTVATTTVSITPVNQAPSLTGLSNVEFVTKGSAVTLSPSVAVTDPDNQDLSSATVKITGGTFAGDDDVLAATTSGTSISASYNAATETLTLSGSDTLAHYQSVLDHITFNSTSANPTHSGADPTRTVTWILNNGGTSNNLSTPVTSTISVTPTVYNWAQGVSGGWNLASNWQTPGIPDAGHTALITKTGIYTVTSAQANTVAILNMATKATLAITNAVFAITAGTGTGTLAGSILVSDTAALQLGAAGSNAVARNAGTITLAAGADPTDLVIVGNAAAAGSGKIILAGDNDQIISNGSAATFSNGGAAVPGGDSIVGVGKIGDSHLSFENIKGTVDADDPGGGTLTIAAASFTNKSLAEATAHGVLLLETDVNNTGGTVKAGAAGATVALDGTAINGGTVITNKGAFLDSIGGSSTLTGTSSVSNSGQLGAEAGDLTISGPVFNAGTLDANNHKLAIAGAVTGAGTATIEGSGEIVFGAAASTRVTFAAGSTGILDLAAPQRFSGTVAGMASGASIDLENIRFADDPTMSYSSTTQQLTIVDSVTHTTDKIKIVGSSSFTDHAASDGSTLISASASASAALLVQSMASLAAIGGPAGETGKITDHHLTPGLLTAPNHG